MRTLLRLSLLLIFGLTAPWVHSETAASLPAPIAYVDDYATVLSPSAKSEFETLCGEVHSKTKAQIFVVTINSLDGANIDQFSNDLFHRWKIGEKKTDRGVLMVFAIKDHKRRIEVGYGLEPILNDAKVGDIGRAMVPDLRSGDYDSAVRGGLHSLAQVISDDANVQLDSLQPASAPPEPAPIQAAPPSSQIGDNPLYTVLFAILFLGILVAVIVSIIRAMRNKDDSAVVRPTLLTDSNPVVFNPTPTSSFGALSAATPDTDSGIFGSSDSSSSSSDSFSGGDGGDSGGGGASGDW